MYFPSPLILVLTLALARLLEADTRILAAVRQCPPTVVGGKVISASCNASSSMPRAPSTFFTHGGGPMPLLGQDPKLAEFLAAWPGSLAEVPAALVIISAHWEEREVSVASGESPSLIFDYGGFPDESYKYKYDAPGHPALAEKIGALISEAGLGDARMRDDRGWDHGVFVPMMLTFPAAKVPIVVVSLVSGYDPAVHWQLGRALRPLRDEGVAIIGSGSSYHNMAGFFGRIRGVNESSAAFDEYITEAVAAGAPEREERIKAWANAPYARDCHPVRAEEHLAPLFVVAGAAHDDERGARIYSDSNAMGSGVTLSAWEFRS